MSTTTDDPPSALAGDAGRLAFELLANVNRTGGICGRRFNLVMRNGFSLPVPDMFADLVGPLRPELDGYIADGSADRNHVPIVGTDGLSPAQFTSPWVWPMGTPARSLVRIAVDHDYRVLGARTFGLIYDGYTSYGTDVADAFRAYVQSLPGASVKMIQSTRSGVAKTGSCNDGCDAVVWAYGPGDAAGWMTAPQTGTRETDGLVFEASSSVAKACGQSLPGTCDNLRVWDPYTPAVGSFLNDPAVAHYGDAAKDGLNPLVEGSYLGVQVLIDAIRRVGPLLTQARLRAALDELRFESSLVGPLTWARSRIGNTSARALKIVNGAFDDAGGGWVADPTPGA